MPANNTNTTRSETSLYLSKKRNDALIKIIEYML